jgi:threonine dehydrogenase-like Zn-dependent dehydrogenase
VKEGDRVALRRSHQKYTVIDPANELMARIPDRVTDEDATWFGIATITQNGVRRAEHKMGDTVVVIGLGILGQLVAQYARLMGAQEVIAVDVSDMRLRAASDFGATITLNKPVEEVKEDVLRITDGRLADVVYDVTGHPKVFQHALTLPRKFGKVILLGDAGTPAEQRLSSDVITRGLQILGTHDGHPPAVPNDENYWTRHNMARLFFHYLERGQVRVCDLTTHRFHPAEAEKAYNLLATDRMNVMGVLFDWTEV